MTDRVLVIEDDEPTRYAYEKALAAAGYQTAGFRDYFAAAPEIDTGAALLVVDIRLPPGTPHGISVAQMARNRHLRLPVIFVTGDIEAAKLADPETGPIMVKPIDLGVLVDTVRDLLARDSRTSPRAI